MFDERKAPRSWQEIVYEHSRESNPEKRKQLREELELALEQRANKLHPQTATHAQKQGA
jgi:hypothetical protein